MLFVPKGYLLLTTAVDQLAGALRLAGQTNEDDEQYAARAKLGAELHSGSISTKVISLSSGHTFGIRSEHWAREIALTWLERGECLLTDDFVDPFSPELAGPGRWPWLRRGESATIFVSEHDFQRLLTQQATKQEPVPSDPIADVEAREKDKGGRPPDYDWEQIKDYGSSQPESTQAVALEPEGAPEAATPKKRGRKKGDGSFANIDLPRLDEMKELILSHRAASPEEAARMLAEKAFGPGSLESKAERLAKRYRERERT
jgi:hypothetical protein